jgi:integrase
MFKKHSAVLPMFRDVIGASKPVSAIKQADVNDFFKLVNKLPPRWKDEIRRRELTIRELAALPHPVSMSPKTFEDTYKACIRAFLQAAKRDWQDQGFPTTLTTDGIEYDGNREEGESKQRALKLEELKRLFQGPEMRAFANDPSLVHCFLLALIGLCTGARVNEICQINPQEDVLEENGIWYFRITQETEGDERIKKGRRTRCRGGRFPFTQYSCN